MRKRGTQDGSVRQKDGKWYGSYFRYVSGLNGDVEYKRKEVTLEATTKRGAKAELRDKYVSKANAQSAVPEGAATLEQFIDARFRPDHIESLKKSGQAHYKYQLLHILPTLGGIRLTDISPILVQQLITAKAGSGLSSQSIRHIKNALSAILRYARDLGFITGMLATEVVRIPNSAPKPVKRQALTVLQATMLLEMIAPKYRPVFQFFLSTGARSSEAAGLRWSDLNLSDTPLIAGGEIRLPYTVHFRYAWISREYSELKSDMSRRDVPMTTQLWVELQTLYERRNPDSDIVFTAVRGKKKPVPMDMHNALNRILKPLGKKLAMPWLNIHTLRHTMATWLDAAGAPMGQRVKMLGHADQTTTMRYTHADMESQREALERAQKMMVS